MNNTVNLSHKTIARIHWLPAAEGGRKHPPRGARYSTAARFEKEAEKWPQEAWSIVAEFTKELDDSSCVEAEIRFLTPEAPAHLLEPGNRFELYEGRRLVARGEVLTECVERSSKMESLQADAIHTGVELQALKA
jgi:hypothetical protein